MDTPNKPTDFRIEGGTVLPLPGYSDTTIHVDNPLNWTKLWEREPGLRPAVPGGYEYADDPDKWHLNWRIFIATWDESAAALGRDAAVRWLQSKCHTLIIQRSDLDDPPVRFWINSRDDQDVERALGGEFNTLDAAIRAAVDAVLTAEGK